MQGYKVITLFALFAFSLQAHASSCCGGGSSTAAAITGDSRYELGFSARRSTVIGDSPAEGRPIFRSSENRLTTNHYQITGALSFAERWQAGAAFSIAQQVSMRAEDVLAQVGYEFLPEWNYDPWMPKGFAFLRFRAPTGRSLYELQSEQSSLSTGRGFYELGAETLFVKRWDFWDAFFSASGDYGFERAFGQPLTTTETYFVSPGWQAALSLGLGANPGDFRIGAMLSPQYQQAKRVRMASTGETSLGAYELVWDTSVSVSYAISDSLSIMASYVDQTLMGPTSNTDLSRSGVLRLTHHPLR